MIYTSQQIGEIIASVAKKYELSSVYLFGSYARNEAREDSDIDILIDESNSKIKSLLDMGAFYDEAQHLFEKEIDVVSAIALNQPLNLRHGTYFRDTVLKEKVNIYERQ